MTADTKKRARGLLIAMMQMASDGQLHKPKALDAISTALDAHAAEAPTCTQCEQYGALLCAICLETAIKRTKAEATRAALGEAAGVADHYADAGRWGRQSDDTARENMAAGAAFVANQIRALADKPDANGGE